MSSQRHRGGPQFSAVELLVVAGIVFLLLAIIFPVFKKSQDRTTQISCINNIRNLSLAIQMYHAEYQAYPHGALSEDLVKYMGGRQDVYTCAASKTDYDTFYVARESNDDDAYVISCPYHQVVNYTPGKGTRTFQFGKVTFNGGSVPVGSRVEGNNKWLAFEDGTKVKVKGAVTILTSFRTADGKLYSIVRILEDDSGTTLDAQVNPGSKFEVITPAAIAGVAGTKFAVDTDLNAAGDYSTDVDVSDGKVKVTGRKGTPSWEPVVLNPGQSKKLKADRSHIQKNPKKTGSTDDTPDD